MEGQYPSDLNSLTIGGRFLTAIPAVGPAGLHPASSAVRDGVQATDEGGWLYHGHPPGANAGNVVINCTHTDAKGSTWAAY